MTDYLTFRDKFQHSLRTDELDKHIIYDDEMLAWFRKQGFDDLAELWATYIQRRSYPNEVEEWVQETLKFLYDDSIERVDASVKVIPEFLLK